MSQVSSTSNDIDLAAEYVLGVLTEQERTRFERRLIDDQRLRDEVVVWEQRLAPMLESVEPVTPPVTAWGEIERRIDPSPSPKTVGLWDNLNFWRSLNLVTASIVLVLGLSLFGWVREPAERQRVMVVTNQESQAGWIVDTRGQDAMLHVSAVQPTPLPSGKVCQLWLKTPEGKLTPLGLLPHRGSVRMQLPGVVRGDSRFFVTIESALHAPVRQPSEEVVFEGQLISI